MRAKRFTCNLKASGSCQAIIKISKIRKLKSRRFLAAATVQRNNLDPKPLPRSLCRCQGIPQARVFNRNTAGCLKLFLLVIRKWNVIQVRKLTEQDVICDVGVVGAVT